ncbi:spore germination protein [Saliterribacillus persicus]|uniref:Spore germination protein KA n=1 Tax=Saliterribacillus persicus TaxID=930114 RepID=A0A368X9F8_9BACI|nr:spore germination protein [Saliterribacillus persicus]RCW64591.1 spore germination protein KA [Saliterribacillus persicus]
MSPFFQAEKSTSETDMPIPTSISNRLEINIEQMKELFSFKVNKDFSYRSFVIHFNKKQATIFYYSSIVNGDKINETILKPLLEEDGRDLSNIITIENLLVLNDYKQIIKHINSGKAVLFVDGDSSVYSLDVADFQHRVITKAENESVIKGPQDAFTESLNVNLSLIRKQMHDRQLISEGMQVGVRSKSEINLLYVKDLVNEEILNNVKKRIEDISVDSIRNVELLEQYLEERPYSIVPTILYTERPDKATAYLEDGFIVILMDTSSACLIVPVTFWSFFHSPEDNYLRYLYGNFSRMIRLLCFYLTTMISATYVAISNFHSEMIPPDLLLAITASREYVPFPLIFEVLIMEIAFEIIREAGIRIPNPLGPTIGIVGALILGQAAVEANIISPIIVIIAALSGLSSFAISDININFTVRLTKFIFILAAGLFGMLALIGVFLLWFMYLASIKSFGVSFFAPLSPHFKSANDTFFRKAIKKQIFRPGQIKPQDMTKRPKDSN